MAEIIGRVGWRNYISPISPLWNNLVAYYRGDNTPNDSKGMYNGTYQRMSWGTPVPGATYSTGIIGNGFILDGTNDYVRLPNIPYTSTSLPFSFSCWFNLTKNGTLYDNIEGGTLKGWNIWMSNGNIFVRLASAGYPTEIRTRTTNALSFNTMYHLTVSYSGNTNASGINIYINGALVSKTTQFNSCTVAALSPNSNYIGTGYFGTTGGLIDEVGIWDRALTAADATELYNGGAGKQYAAPAPAYTARTTAFAASTGITDATILNALNTFDTGLISNGLDTKMKALYPFVGGTANTHKFNFMNAQDTDAAFRLAFNGGWVHSSTGVKGNGVNTYANSFYNPLTNSVNKNNFGISAYSRTNNLEDGTLVGAEGAGNSRIDIRPRYSSTIDVLSCYDDSWGYGNYLTNSLGLFSANRLNTTQKYYQNSTEKHQRLSFAATSDINFNIYIGARNFFDSRYATTSREISFVAWHDYFDSTNMTTFYNLVQTLQTTLGRQV